jgi:hypothetical protein
LSIEITALGYIQLQHIGRHVPDRMQRQQRRSFGSFGYRRDCFADCNASDPSELLRLYKNAFRK